MHPLNLPCRYKYTLIHLFALTKTIPSFLTCYHTLPYALPYALPHIFFQFSMVEIVGNRLPHAIAKYIKYICHLKKTNDNKVW